MVGGKGPYLFASGFVPAERGVVLQPVTRAVLVHGEPALKVNRVPAFQSLVDFETSREALPRVLRVQPEPAEFAKRVARRVLNCFEPVFDPLRAFAHRELVHPAAVKVRGLYAKPVQTVRPERARLREHQRASANVGAKVVQMHVHRVRSAAEVDVVWKIDALFFPHFLRDLQFNKEVTPLAVQFPDPIKKKVSVLYGQSGRRCAVKQERPLPIRAFHPVQAVNEPGNVLPAGNGTKRVTRKCQSLGHVYEGLVLRKQSG